MASLKHQIDVLLFASQGSKSHFSDKTTVDELREALGDAKELFSRFLHECWDAFTAEYAILPSEEQFIFGESITTAFGDPESLLFPPPSYQDHPVLETTTLYIRQILELILYDCRKSRSQIITETAGICTGVLPAILAASESSFHSDEFLESAVHGFRLAFYIGLRVSLFCRSAEGDQWRDCPWALVISGLSTEELQDKIRKYIGEDGSTPLVKSKPWPRVSAIYPQSTISLTGCGHGLREFRSTVLTPSVPCRPAHIHGYYHGGEEAVTLVEQVLFDAQRRGIVFPNWRCLRVPVRPSTIGSQLFSNAYTGSRSLMESLLRSIFIETVDWETTRDAIVQSISAKLDDCDDEVGFRIVGMGPNSRSLTRAVRGISPISRLTIIDHFPDHNDDIFSEAVAIVGLSVNYPLGKGPEEFWSTLENGVCAVSEIPNSRFDISQYYSAEDSPSSSAKRKMNSKHGNFLNDPFDFDAPYFNISPREAKSMDPQQRQLLYASVEALEDAGYSPNSTKTFQKDSFGVYVGVATGDYVDNLRDEIDVYYSPGTLRAFLSGRISYAFGFKGPSMVIDTACSSSMVSLYHACRALLSGDCTAALAGGVNIISSPDMYLGLSRAHFLSPTGQCKPFDVSADGYCRAEGCGIMVLKKLSQAVKEGDHIYGVIRGIAVNQCGTAKSITHPDHETQAELFKKVLQLSRVKPESISVVEAHGTGTQAGDYSEIQSLQSTFGRSRSPSNPLYLMSLKGNIGHAEAASGVAGLAKLLLMLDKKKIPPQASFKELNPRLATIADHNIVIPTEVTDWNPTSSKAPRRAMLNNFGAAGSNAALILEEYTPKHHRPARLELQPPMRSAHVLNIAAKTTAALEKLRVSYMKYIDSHPDIRIEDLCYTANARRREEDYHVHRLSVVASTVGELAAQLEQSECLSRQMTRAREPRKVVFVFSGQGGVYPGMGRELLSATPEFKKTVERCDSILTRNGYPPTTAFLANSGSWSNKDRIIVEQCACFVVEYALARLLMTWGIMPDLVMGHSIGEYAALAVAGTVSLEDAMLFVAKRALLMTTKCDPETSGMMACRISPSEIREILSEGGPSLSCLSVACDNSPQDSVIAGPLGPLGQVAEICKQKGIKYKLLPVSFGFHSGAMDPILEDLKLYSSSISVGPRSCSTRVGSSLYGRLLSADEDIKPDYFVQQTREPVQFSRLANGLDEFLAGADTSILEVGPSPITLPLLRAAFQNPAYILLPTLKPSAEPWVTLASLLQSLYLQGHSIRWREVYNGTSPKFLRAFPQYPLAGSEFVIPFREQQSPDTMLDKASNEELHGPFEFLSAGRTSVTELGATFKTQTKKLSKFIKAHAVGGVPLCPASVYMEFFLEGLAVMHGMSQAMYVIENTAFDKPLVYHDGNEDTVRLEIVGRSRPEPFRFSFESEKGQVYCTGDFTTQPSHITDEILLRRGAYVKKQRLASFGPENSRSTERFSRRTIYQVVFPRVVAYDDPFLTLNDLTISATGLEGHGRFKLAPSALEGQFVSPPAFIDTMLHSAGFIANAKVEPEVACICTKLDRAMLPGNDPELYLKEMEVYCSLMDIGDAIVADAYVLDAGQKVISCVEGMYFKKIQLASFKAHLSRIARVLPDERGRSALATTPLLVADKMRTSPAAEQATPPRKDANVEDTVHSILRDVCGSHEVKASSTLSEMGVDSLLLLELAHSICNHYPDCEVLRSDLERCATVGDLVNVVTEATREDSSSNVSTPQLTNNSTPNSVRRLAHTPVKGVLPPGSIIEGSPMESLFLDVCGLCIMESDKNASLSSLGVDSLLSMELLAELDRRFGIIIHEGHEVISDLTFSHLEDMHRDKLTAAPSGGGARPYPRQNNTLAQQQTQQLQQQLNPILSEMCRGGFPMGLQVQKVGAPKTSLYLFHDGSGVCSMYRRLPDMERTVHGIFSLDLALINPSMQHMEDLARLYIERAGLASKSNLILGGWSFGGVLAFEVSRQLRRLGKAVQGVVLVDSPVPDAHQALPREVIAHVVGTAVSDQAKQPRTPTRKEALDCIEAQFIRHSRMLENYQPPRGEGKDVPCVLVICMRNMDTERLCGVAYPWLNDQAAREASIEGWCRLLGRQVPVLEVDCNHFEVFDVSHVSEVAEKLEQACKICEV